MDESLVAILASAGFRLSDEGAGPALSFARIDTPLGAMLALGMEDGLCLLEFLDRIDLAGQLVRLRSFFPLPLSPAPSATLERAEEELGEYFDRGRRDFGIPLKAPGTDFQERVWKALRAIPRGRTLSYGELAAAVGEPGAARAVGAANARNRIAIIIPCHRVVPASGGGRGGYAGGPWRKERLLEMESRG